MRFVGALDPIFVLAIARKVLDHFVNTTRHKPTDCRVEGYKLSDLEFVRAHISVAPLFTQPSAFRFRANLVTQIPVPMTDSAHSMNLRGARLGEKLWIGVGNLRPTSGQR